MKLGTIEWIDKSAVTPLVRIERFEYGLFSVHVSSPVFGGWGYGEAKTMLAAMHKAFSVYQYWLSVGQDQELGE